MFFLFPIIKNMAKRISLIIVAFFAFNYVKAQAAVSGVAIYRVIPVLDAEASSSNDMAKSLEPFSEQIASKFNFKLAFNSKGSIFYLVEDKSLNTYSENSIKLSAIQYGYADTVWQQEEQAFTKTHTGFAQKKAVLLRENLKNPAWKISKEQKQIGDFTCYKATRTLVVRRGKKTFSTAMIAWFCPDIPVSWGPLSFGGLPGLVLEAQTNKFLYGLQQIQFLKQHQFSALPSYSRFTEEELINSLSNPN